MAHSHSSRTLGIAFLVLAICGLVGAVYWRSRDTATHQSILVVLKTLDNPYYVEMKQGVERAKAELGEDVDVIIKAPYREDDIAGQLRLLKNYLEAGSIIALSIAPASSKDVVPVIREFNNKAIPVIVLDTRLDPTALKTEQARYDSFIGSDNQAGGELAAEYIGKHIGDKETRILVLEGVPHQETAISRTDGFKKVHKAQFPKWHVTYKTANWNQQEARTVTDDLLSSSGVPAAIFGCNDEMALGAIAALEAHDVPQDTWPVIVGFDATPDALKAIDNRRMSATVQQKPHEMGQAAVKRAIQALHRDSALDQDTLIPVELIER